MYEKSLLRELHTKLQSLDPRITLLLGGSYAYGEAHEDSDVDFYAVLPWTKLLSYHGLKHKIQNLKDSYFGVRFSVMIVPRFFFERGWFYVHGHDECGDIHASPINTRSIIRHSLKLALFHYFLFLISPDRSRKIRELLKIAKLSAVLRVLTKTIYIFQPLFSVATLSQHLDPKNNSIDKTIMEALQKGREFSSEELSSSAAVLYEYLKTFYTENKHHFRFSLLNSLVYALQGIRHRSSLFWTSNPDTMVINYLLDTIENKRENLKEEEKKITTIIFPVLII